MPKFAANVSMMYPEHDFLDRFAAAARDGFAAVEFQFPYDYPAATLAERLSANRLGNVLFNLPPGDWNAGERGLAALPGRELEFQALFAGALAYAVALGTKRLHALAGFVPAGADPARCRDTYIRNLRHATERAGAHAITILIEPLNPRDMPGYFLTRQDEAHRIREAVGLSNLKVQMDLYHCQIVEGDLATKLRRYLPGVGHIQIAGVPERHEPDTGEVNYPYLFDLLDGLGYDGWIGAEYRPRAGTSAGLGWVRRYLADRA